MLSLLLLLNVLLITQVFCICNHGMMFTFNFSILHNLTSIVLWIRKIKFKKLLANFSQAPSPILDNLSLLNSPRGNTCITF